MFSKNAAVSRFMASDGVGVYTELGLSAHHAHVRSGARRCFVLLVALLLWLIILIIMWCCRFRSSSSGVSSIVDDDLQIIFLPNL